MDRPCDVCDQRDVASWLAALQADPSSLLWTIAELNRPAYFTGDQVSRTHILVERRGRSRQLLEERCLPVHRLHTVKRDGAHRRHSDGSGDAHLRREFRLRRRQPL